MQLRTTLRALLLAALIAASLCQAQRKLSIHFKQQGTSTAFASLGSITYDFGSGNNNVEISDTQAYSTILKNSQATYQFEFRASTDGKPALKSPVRIPKGATSLGFQLYGSTSEAVSAVNVVVDTKSKAAFVRTVKPDKGDLGSVIASQSVSDFADLSEESPVESPEIPNLDGDAKGSRQKPLKEEKKPQPWYKEYFWYIVIGGFFLYRILSMDKTALAEQIAEAKKQAEEIQGKKAQKKDK